MLPTPRHIIAIALTLALVLGGVLLVRTWLEARDDRARLAATLEAQRQVISAAGQREQQRAGELSKALDQIAALKRRVHTPQEIISALPQSLPPLPEPIHIQLSGAAASGAGKSPADATSGDSHPLAAAAGAKSDSPPAIATIPQADLKPLYDYVQDCRACQLQLTSATADLADERAKSQALVLQRDAAVKAAKGGSLWLRLKRGAKWMAIGLAVGAAAGAAAR